MKQIPGLEGKKTPDKKRRRRFGFVFLAALMARAFSGGPFLYGQQGPGAFAGTLEISGIRDSLMVLELPEQIYVRSRRPDLGDLRVFDAGGTPVPFLVRSPPPLDYLPPPEPLPFFVWNAPGPPKAADIEINAAGAVIKVTGAEAAAGLSESYILDLHELSRAPARLCLDFEEGDFSGPVELFFARVLGEWRSLGRRTLARYSGGGNTVERTGVELSGEERAYLLISPQSIMPRLRAVTAEFPRQSLPGKTRESRFTGTLASQGREALFSTGGFYPVLSLDFVLQGADFFDVEVWSRLFEEDPWNYETGGLLYLFTGEDGTRRNRPFELKSPAPFWRLSLSGETPFTVPPELILSWEPRELVFLARGEGPWILAYGNAAVAPPPDTLRPGAIAGEPLEASVPGAEQYRDPGKRENRDPGKRENRGPSRSWLLWGSLVVSVLVLTGLAVYAGRSMNKQKENL